MSARCTRNDHKRVFTGGKEGDDGGNQRQDYRNGKKPRLNKNIVNKHVKEELHSETAIRKEEARKARSRGVKVASKPYSKKGKRNVPGKSHGAPSRSKAIIKRR